MSFSINIGSIGRMVNSYENGNLLEKALNVIPLSTLRCNALTKFRAIQKKNIKKNESLEESALLESLILIELLTWFKVEFFQWMDSPTCEVCNIKGLKMLDLPGAVGSDVNGIEVYSCPQCNKKLTFVRYSNADTLLKTRTGRCSEYAQVFTLICRALGYDTRFVHDVTDHAWTEIYSHIQRRWIHCDPSEGIFDTPLIYEKGWNKSLSYILAVGIDEVQDVTWRYSANHLAVLNRRTPTVDTSLLKLLAKCQNDRYNAMPKLRKKFLLNRLVCELVELLGEPVASGEYGGRQSGSSEWREQRGELGSITQVGYVFELSQPRANEKKFGVWYSANKDAYIVLNEDNKKDILLRGWDNYAYCFKNMIRKEELDWKNTYLARENNAEPGMVTWKFDISQTDLVIIRAFILTNFHTVENGVASCHIYNSNNSIRFNNEKMFQTSPLRPNKSLTVEINLGGGSGSNAWQHAQMGRQPMSDGPSVCLGVVLFLENENDIPGPSSYCREILPI